MDYMKKKTPIKGLLFYAIQGLDAPISVSLDGDDAYVTDTRRIIKILLRVFNRRCGDKNTAVEMLYYCAHHQKPTTKQLQFF